MQINKYEDYEVITKKDEKDVLQVGVLRDNIWKSFESTFWKKDGADLIVFNKYVIEIFVSFPEFLFADLDRNKILYLIDVGQEGVQEVFKEHSIFEK